MLYEWLTKKLARLRVGLVITQIYPENQNSQRMLT
jgi:hypothetical protein